MRGLGIPRPVSSYREVCHTGRGPRDRSVLASISARRGHLTQWRSVELAVRLRFDRNPCSELFEVHVNSAELWATDGLLWCASP